MNIIRFLRFYGFLNLVVITSLYSTNYDQELIVAAAIGDAGGVEAALQKGANINTELSPEIEAEWSGAKSVLHISLKQNNSALALLLLQRGADVNKAQQNSLKPLHIAAFFQDDINVLSAILDKGANVNEVAGARTTSLEILATKNKPNVDAIKLLLDRGVDKVRIDDAVQALQEKISEVEGVLANETDAESREELEQHIIGSRDIINMLCSSSNYHLTQ